jgi:hypothetical protein
MWRAAVCFGGGQDYIGAEWPLNQIPATTTALVSRQGWRQWGRDAAITQEGGDGVSNQFCIHTMGHERWMRIPDWPNTVEETRNSDGRG